MLIYSWGHENREIPNAMPGRHFNQILIQTKLNRPAIGPNSVVRPRLISRLDDVLKERVTLICAPAGYGKTTLVLQWLDQRRMPAAWFAVDETDSDPDRFLSYFVAAVRTVVPEFGSDIVRLLSSPQLPPLEYLADAVVNELATLDRPLAIVLDDYHRIDRSSPVHELIGRLLEHPPRQMHLVLATRRDPPPPEDDKMKSTDRTIEQLADQLQGGFLVGGLTSSDSLQVQIADRAAGGGAGCERRLPPVVEEQRRR